MSLMFPLELHEQIIDALRGDNATLLHCALTCRAWLPRSRYNLYFEVAPQHHAQLTRLTQTLRSSPDFVNLVQELTIPIPIIRPATWIDSTCAILAHDLPQVKKVTISHTLFPNAQYYPHTRRIATISRRAAICIAQFTTVTHVILFELELSSFVDLARVVIALRSSLSNLECHGLWWSQVGTIVAGSPMRKTGWLNLESLLVVGTWRGIAGVTMLFGAVNPNSLRRLTLDVNLPTDGS
ncbi:hypothetical protein BC628DRAFT_420059 [Trametes gibbosa]|nr:hypothetical protein BC628DRAFT_420059 [Trametes gibbosa]